MFYAYFIDVFALKMILKASKHFGVFKSFSCKIIYYDVHLLGIVSQVVSFNARK